MSRPIAYNTPAVAVNGSITNEDKVISYVVDGRGNDYYNGYADRLWVPSADGAAPIVFVTDTYTRGIEADPLLSVPLFFACAGTSSAAIIYTANRLPGSPGNYSNANTALDELNRIYGYFILESNDPFQGDFQNGNLLTIDASKMTSYPQTANNWYDMSGNGFSFSLVNGPSFQSGGWFNIDGTDDAIILTGNSALQSTNTLVVWLRTTDTTGLLLTGSPLNSTGPYYVAAYYPGQGFYSGTAGSPDYFMNTLATVNPATPINYLDGRFHMWEVKGLSFGGWTTTWNFFNYQAGYQIAGDVAKIQMFNSYLTAAQSKQLYFGAPIVTDGLVFAVDANNIVSYPKSGTTAYSLTGSLTGTLTNGVGYLPNNGGTWNFDGTDDYIDCGNSSVFNFTNTTISCWFRKSKDSLYKGLVDKGRDGYGAWSLNVDEIYSTATFKANISGTARAITALSAYDENAWTNVVGVFDGTNLMIYQNGVLSNSASYPGSMNTNSTSVRIGAANDGLYYNGEIANTKIYNRALSASEILQNYQAEQYRFETPAGIPTSGLQLWLDAGNLDSYPGTGTTWYDLSSQSNNMTLVNGPTYNQTNGGVIIFDGIDDYAQRTLSNCSTSFKTMTEYTVVSVFQSLDSTTDWNCLYSFGDTSPGNIDNWQQTGTRYFGSDNQSLYTTVDLYTAGINMWAQTFTSGDNKIYRNNTLNTSNAAATITNPFTAAGFVIASNSDNFGYPTTMNMNLMLIYNRVLTTAELTQIYNYYKGRFGL